MKRLTDPIENLRCYIMVHGGIDAQERILDVEYLEDVLKAAKEVTRARSYEPHYIDERIGKLRDALSG